MLLTFLSINFVFTVHKHAHMHARTPLPPHKHTHTHTHTHRGILSFIDIDGLIIVKASSTFSEDTIFIAWHAVVDFSSFLFQVSHLLVSLRYIVVCFYLIFLLISFVVFLYCNLALTDVAHRKLEAEKETQRLGVVQKELTHLDNIVSSDVSILRERIEAATLEFNEATYVLIF